MTKKFVKSLIFLFMLLFFTTTQAGNWDSNPNFKYQKFNEIGLWGNVQSQGSGIIVAVIDEGVWISHPDLSQNIWVNPGEISNNKTDDDHNGYIDDYYGWNFLDNNNDMETKGSHGTSVAGIIAAIDNSQGIVGVASGAKIMPLIACNNSGCNQDAVINAIKYATDHGANVINLSLGTHGYLGYKDDYNNVINYAYNHNVVIVASAGNGDVESASSRGQNLDIMPASPVSNDVNNINMVLGVGALNAPWSNYGSAVDVVAPGIHIISTVVPIYDDGYYYGFVDGTSFSAPFVSGAVALYKALYPQKKNWEIIDKFKYQKQLDVAKIMDNNITFDRQCTIDSLSLDNNSGEIFIYGSYFRSDIIFHIQTKDGSSLSNASPYMTILDATNIKLNIRNLKIGDYVFITTNDYCRKKSVNFSVIYDYSNTVTTPTGSDIKEVSNDDGFLLEEKGLLKAIDKKLSEKLKGKILLQIEGHGEAWYINPKNNKRYYMANGNEAYKVMRNLGVGINNKDLGKIWAEKNYAKKHSGKIFLQIEANGEAYYIDFNGVAHYLKNGDEAYKIMRDLGLGIKNDDIRKIDIN
ncbi:MAG: S8 family serine peptidase [bacterium]|nr:S8 family serine peptidase [bacterium]